MRDNREAKGCKGDVIRQEAAMMKAIAYGTKTTRVTDLTNTLSTFAGCKISITDAVACSGIGSTDKI